jgi:hypothetical protein
MRFICVIRGNAIAGFRLSVAGFSPHGTGLGASGYEVICPEKTNFLLAGPMRDFSLPPGVSGRLRLPPKFWLFVN